MSQKKTVGAASFELLKQNHAQESAIDYERAMHEQYEQSIYDCIDTHKSVFTGDFYVVVLRKRERLMPNVYRNYFFGRISCPTPTYDQVVYRYIRDADDVQFLWVVPDQETCVVFKRDALHIAPDEKELLQFILDFYDGTLDKLAQKLNNEDKYGTRESSTNDGASA